MNQKPPPHTAAKNTDHVDPVWVFAYHPDHGTVFMPRPIGPADGHKTLDDWAKEYAGSDHLVERDPSNINTLGDFRVCFTNDPKRFFETCIDAASFNYVEEES